MHRISKTYSFDAAHRLVKGYAGKCAHLHGHTWSVTVFLQADTLDSVDMVVDFNALKPLKERIDAELDHSVIACIQDTALIQWCKDNGQRHYVMFSNPTSEAIARMIYVWAQDEGWPVCAVEVKETCTSAARYEP